MIHRETTFCGHTLTPTGGVATWWAGACDCGFTGESHPSSGSAGPDAAHADYREHVETALGAEAYYDAHVACRNCGSRHAQSILIGTHVDSGACSRCGTRMLQPDNETWHENRPSPGIFDS